MKRIGIFSLMVLLAPLLAACSPGHLGSNELAFVRSGVLWTIDPDGANAFAVARLDTAVVGYSWSPSHQILAFRTLDADYAKTAQGQQPGLPLLGFREDVPSTVNTVGIDGGTSIPILYSNAMLQYSNPIWNASNSRLLYRQESATPPFHPDSATWLISQNDQPAGIAAKLLPASYSFPSFSPDGQTILGNFTSGVFATTLAGIDRQSIIANSLPGHPLPASLERVLWQPAHAHPSILYAVAAVSPQTGQLINPQLMLYSQSQGSHVLLTCSCTQFAWSPDGTMILYRAGATYRVYTLATQKTFTLPAEAESVPYWSPDSQFLLFDGSHALSLVRIADHQQQVLLQDTTSPDTQTAPPLPSADALLQTVPNSLWAADSRHFLFLTRGRLLWQHQPLTTGKGLYTISIDDTGHSQGTPSLTDNGDDTQAGWSYQDANTSFLY